MHLMFNTMKTRLHLTLSSLAIMLIGTGCYTSPVPIGPLDEAPRLAGLTGEWITPEAYLDEDDSPMRLLIESSDDLIFSIVATSTNPQETDTLRFEAYATRLGEVLYGNLKILSDSDEEGYLIVRVAFPEAGAMRIALVSDELMEPEPSTSDALRAFLLANTGNPALFEDGDTYFVRLE